MSETCRKLTEECWKLSEKCLKLSEIIEKVNKRNVFIQNLSVRTPQIGLYQTSPQLCPHFSDVGKMSALSEIRNCWKRKEIR